MRIFALVLLVVSGCSLYYGSSNDDVSPPNGGGPPGSTTSPPDASLPPDAGPSPDALEGQDGLARCEDGQIYEIALSTTNTTQPPHGSGSVIGRCPGACRSAAAFCPGGDCSSAVPTLCEAPASTGASCALAGTACQGTASIDCPEVTACSESVPGATCTCRSGVYSCTPVTTAATTQASIVGKWRGSVTPPPGFPTPWPITLWIYPDGTYWAECAGGSCVAALWFEPDGPSPRRKITLLSTAPLLGSWADITVDTGFSPPNIGALSALVVNATTLRFTFTPSYFSCGDPIDVVLTRE